MTGRLAARLASAPAALLALAALAACADLSFVALEEEREHPAAASVDVRWLHLDSLRVDPDVVLDEWAVDSPQVRFGDTELSVVWESARRTVFGTDSTLAADSLVGPVPLILPATPPVRGPIELRIPLLRRVGERRVCDDGSGAVALVTQAEPAPPASGAWASWRLMIDADRDPDGGVLAVSWQGRGYPGSLRVPVAAMPDADTLSALLMFQVRSPAAPTDAPFISTRVTLYAEWEIVLAPEGACDAPAP